LGPARILAKFSDFPRWSGLLCEHRGIAEHHLRFPRSTRRVYKSLVYHPRFDLLTFLILLPPPFPPASMIGTKAESQNYLANPYSSLGPLSLQYVLFSPFSVPSFRLHACHLSNGHERGVIRRTEATLLPGLDRPPDTIHQFSRSPCFRSALIPVRHRC
jgi:hypothetical protein